MVCFVITLPKQPLLSECVMLRSRSIVGCPSLIPWPGIHCLHVWTTLWCYHMPSSTNRWLTLLHEPSWVTFFSPIWQLRATNYTSWRPQEETNHLACKKELCVCTLQKTPETWLMQSSSLCRLPQTSSCRLSDFNTTRVCPIKTMMLHSSR